MLSAHQLREIIDYEPKTGVFLWKHRARSHFKSSNQWKNWNGRYPETVAGSLHVTGYRIIAIHDRLYRAHRLAWLYVYGEWPSNQIDHINGAKDDNRIENLRDVANAENAKNRRREGTSSSGRVGVTPYRRKSGGHCWVARIRVDGKLKHLGYFDTKQDAILARAKSEQEYCFSTWPRSKAKIAGRGFQKTRG